MPTPRPICPSCNQRPRLVAYHKYGRIYYRSKCLRCYRKAKRQKEPTPKWQSAGYKKKPACDRCGFRARYSAQLRVFHIDGNMNNATIRNLKTICLNCQVDVDKANLIWKPGDLESDF